MSYPLAEISLSALHHNLQQVRQHASQAKVMAVIKADAYGHGAIQVAKVLSDSDAFAVARLPEAILLRKQNISQPIVVLEGLQESAQYEQAAQYELSLVFHHLSQLEQVEQNTLSKPIRGNWLMVDTGMHRLGIRPEAARAALSRLENNQNIDGEVGLMSHFANADLVGDPRNQAQLEPMLQLRKQTGRALCLANSAAVLSMPQSHQQWVRPGLMLYGLSPFADKTAEQLNLRAVMRLKSSLIAVYPVTEGEQVGYGGSWSASRPSTVGVVSIGYGDGYNRLFSNQSMVLINGRLAPVIGRVSMDSVCVDLTDLDGVKMGDEVTLWGNRRLTVESLANLAQTIPYELVTVICQRVEKEFIDG